MSKSWQLKTMGKREINRKPRKEK